MPQDSEHSATAPTNEQHDAVDQEPMEQEPLTNPSRSPLSRRGLLIGLLTTGIGLSAGGIGLAAFLRSRSGSATNGGAKAPSLLYTYRGHDPELAFALTFLGWSPQSTRLVSIDYGTQNEQVGPSVHLWDALNGEHLSVFHLPTGATPPQGTNVLWTQQGLQVVWNDAQAVIHVSDVLTGKDLLTFSDDSQQKPGQDSRVAFSCSPDGQSLVTLGLPDDFPESEIRVWNLATGKPQASLHLPPSPGQQETDQLRPLDWRWSPDSKHLVCWYLDAGQADADLYVWDVSTGQMHVRYTGHRDQPDQDRFSTNSGTAFRSVSWSPDSRWIASLATTQTQGHLFHLWDANTGEQLHTLTIGDVIPEALTEQIALAYLPVRWSPDGRYLAFCGQWTDGQVLMAGQIQVWKTTTATRLFTKQLPTIPFSFAWSPDSQLLAGNAPGLVLWNATTGQPTVTYPSPEEDKEQPHLISWSPDGQYVATATNGFQVQVWTEK